MDNIVIKKIIFIFMKEKRKWKAK